MRLLVLALVSAGAAVTGCGGGGAGTGTSTSSRSPRPPARSQTGTTTSPTSTTPAATIPTVPRTTPPATTTSPEQQPGGAGDEEAPRVPAQFTYKNGKLTPPLVMVPATFRIAVTVTFADGKPHAVSLGGRKVRVTRAVASAILPGLAKGKSLTVTIDGRPAGRIASGLQPGP